ncbi:hypothetical protein M2171_006516 [Bradyrhizobium japonicum USDA 38]|uniref:hypothetical protein n=1 Tax=Bradyrhizobium TaxID=374 RepID=UPI001FCE6BFD|nr:MULTISPECIES: hypothetical protein [Bradyrhizobium]MCS3897383.1 hypothetical protein [Bradyrhizobium japonicum USDA 38]MCS3949898.1 hypothetical protein [Bradyrhizobium japonicum]
MPRRSAGAARIGFENTPIKSRVRPISRRGIFKKTAPAHGWGWLASQRAPEPSHLRRRLGSKDSGGDSNIRLYYHRLHVQIVPSGVPKTESLLPLVKSLEPMWQTRFSNIIGAIRVPEGIVRLMPRWKEEWTEQEVEKLRSLAATMPLTLIAKELNRTVGTVLAKATYEKIKIIVHTRSGRA